MATKPKKKVEATPEVAPAAIPVAAPAPVPAAPASASPTPTAKSDPKPEQKEKADAPAKPRREFHIDWLSSSMLFFALLIVAGVAYMAMNAIQATANEGQIKIDVATKLSEVAAKSKSTATVPVLTLNKTNKRLGPEISVNQSDIGKTNPFAK